MTIQITRPETEALINRQLRTGEFQNPEDVIYHALQCLPAEAPVSAGSGRSAKDMVELFEPLRGLNIDFETDRSQDIGRDINL